ncbi:MAG TPA: hypothetical protein VK671_15515 [Mucilaginibacter sp.]|jgi:hypothetical protein|nr:hypothetical protein [Mucilaginibacter sp.]
MIKKLALFFAILLFCALFTHAQNVNRVNIPLVKENQKIDALLDKYVKLGDPARSCFVLYADPIGGLYGLTVKGIKTDTSILNLNFLRYKAEFGYFKYKKYLVIVVNTYDLFNFFEQTPHNKTFRYRWNPAGANKYFCSADYNYPIGQFDKMTFSDPVPMTEIRVQAVTTDKKIDSLLEKYIGLSDPAKSCFMMSSSLVNGEYSISVNGLRTDTTVLNMNVFSQKIGIGYFRYKGYLVIVKLYADPYHFFNKGGHSRTFRFEWDERKAEDKELNPLGETFCYNNYYRDKYGNFNSSVIFDRIPQKADKQ